MKNIYKCLHQIFRPSLHVDLYGWGNCTICKTDEHNKNCKGFYPVNINVIKFDDRISED